MTNVAVVDGEILLSERRNDDRRKVYDRRNLIRFAPGQQLCDRRHKKDRRNPFTFDNAAIC